MSRRGIITTVIVVTSIVVIAVVVPVVVVVVIVKEEGEKQEERKSYFRSERVVLAPDSIRLSPEAAYRDCLLDHDIPPGAAVIDNQFLPTECLEEYSNWKGQFGRWTSSEAQDESTAFLAYYEEVWEERETPIAEVLNALRNMDQDSESTTSDPTEPVEVPEEPASFSRVDKVYLGEPIRVPISIAEFLLVCEQYREEIDQVNTYGK